MAFTLEESFEVSAPVDRVWAYLIDPERVAPCLSGARLTDVRDETTFVGEITVKVGPVKASYEGKVRLLEVDEGARRVKMSGEGSERSGGGSAQMTMVSRMTELPGGGTRVEVASELEVVGKLAQFGRGMVEQVGRQLFRQFAECVRDELGGDEEEGAGAEEGAPGSGRPGAPEAVRSREAGATTDPSPAARAAGRSSDARGDGDDHALDLLPVLFSALREKIRSLFGRGG